MEHQRQASSSSLPATVAVTLAHVMALAVFMTGFLLTRIELPKYSQCSEPPASFEFMTEFARRHDFSSQYHFILNKWIKAGKPHLEGSESTDVGCWTERRFHKAILVIIDALRFDFVHSDPDEPETRGNHNFRNHLRLFDKLQSSHPENCKLFVFEADPPTTTMQRLKGIVTGGMPTFIDFSSNFDSNSITEDNILFQLSQTGLEIVMMGDDTWIKLFPNIFRRAYPFPSFNVKDLHTVDDGVIAHLRPEVDAGKFNLLIAHFLGVDHVGHRFYANHPTMKDKLQQLDKVLEDLVSAIDENTVLFILGDHGMTSEGNHGGTSKQETDAALFTYSKQKIFPKSDQPHVHPHIKQVDLVPTLSLLLGSSIPYSSLGTVMTDLFTVNASSPWKRACGVLRINAWQVQRYLHDYSSTSLLFEPEQMQHLTAEFLSVDHDYIQLAIHLHSEQFDAGAVYMDLAKRYEAILSLSQFMCREKWTMFDLTCMIFGVILLLFIGLAIALNAGLEPVLSRGFIIKTVFISIATLSPLICYWSGVAAHISVLISTAVGVIISIIISSFTFSRRRLCFPHNSVLIVISLLVPYMAGLFSNSLVITESFVMHYYTVSLCILLGLFDLRHPSAKVPHIALTCFLTIFCLRLMGDGKSFGPGAMLPDDFFSFWQLLQTFGSLMVLAIVSFFYSRLICHHIMRILFMLYSLACFSIISLYWFLDATVVLDQHTSWHFLPQLVYGASFVLCILTILFRKCLGRHHCLNLLLVSIMAPWMLLLGPKSSFVFMLTLAVIYLRFYRLLYLGTFVHSDIPECTFFWSLGIQLYFATGHSNSFSSLQVSSAFVGFELFDYYRSGALLFLNTFGGFILCGLGLAIVSPDYSPEQIQPLHKSDHRLQGYAFERPAMVMIALHMIRSAFSTLNVLVNRRHLMVWDIFAPKFVFDAATMATIAVIMVGIALINNFV